MVGSARWHLALTCGDAIGIRCFLWDASGTSTLGRDRCHLALRDNKNNSKSSSSRVVVVAIKQGCVTVFCKTMLDPFILFS
jgi:hypothetical protein